MRIPRRIIPPTAKATMIGVVIWNPLLLEDVEVGVAPS
jgi:hypothetical protein